MPIRISTPIVNLLTERGLIPPHCRNVDLSIPASGPMVLTFEVFITEKELEILGEAFTAQAAIARQEYVDRQARVSELVRDGK